MEFPGDVWFEPAWKAVACHFRRKGEHKFIDLIEKNVIDPRKSGSIAMGWAALGLTTSVNALERGNCGFRNGIAESLHKMNKM